MLSKKEHNEIAAVLANAHDPCESNDDFTMRRWIGGELAEYFADNNPRFDRERFEKIADLV